MPKAAKKHPVIQETIEIMMNADDRRSVELLRDSALARIGELSRERKAFVSQNNADLKVANDDVDKQVTRLSQGMVDVLCNLEFAYDVGVVRYRRADSKDKEVVKTRKMTDAERQKPLQFETSIDPATVAISDAAKAKQPGLSALPDDPPEPETPEARLDRLGWKRDENRTLIAPPAEAERLAALGDALAARCFERIDNGRDPRCVLAWAEDRKRFDDALPTLADKVDHETFDAVVKEVNESDLSYETALLLLDGKVTADEARKLPRPGDPIIETLAAAPAELENVNPDHVPIAPWVDLTDEERDALKSEIGTESEAIVEWAIHLLKGGTERSQAIASARKHEAQEDEQAGDAAAAGAPASEKQRSKAAQLQQKIEPRVGKRLADCAHDDVVQGTKLQLAKEKALEALKQSRTLTPEQVADIGGDDSVFFADFLAALYAGEDFSEALLDAKIACQKHADNVAAAQERERLEAVQAGETFESAPTDDAPREDIAAAAKAAFDAALPQDDSKPKRAKKSGGAR